MSKLAYRMVLVARAFGRERLVACEIDAPMQATWLESGGFTVMNLASCVSVSVTLVCQP